MRLLPRARLSQLVSEEILSPLSGLRRFFVAALPRVETLGYFLTPLGGA
jgi:hypothetical protein